MSKKPDILQVLHDAGIRLQRSGNRYRCLCLFHNERTPSMTIYPEQNRFFCFSCKAHGDSFDIITKLTGKTFREIAGKTGYTPKGPERLSSILKRVFEKIERQNYVNKICSIHREAFELIRSIRTEQEMEAIADLLHAMPRIEHLHDQVCKRRERNAKL